MEISVLDKKKVEKGLKRFVCVTAKSDDFVEKSSRFDEKSATKSTFVRTHREALYSKGITSCLHDYKDACFSKLYLDNKIIPKIKG